MKRFSTLVLITLSFFSLNSIELPNILNSINLEIGINENITLKEIKEEYTTLVKINKPQYKNIIRGALIFAQTLLTNIDADDIQLPQFTEKTKIVAGQLLQIVIESMGKIETITLLLEKRVGNLIQEIEKQNATTNHYNSLKMFLMLAPAQFAIVYPPNKTIQTLNESDIEVIKQSWHKTLNYIIRGLQN